MNRVTSFFRRWWAGPSGYRDVLSLAGPLIVSTGTWAVHQFTNRVFLAWHSETEMAAALPAGLLAYSMSSFFSGVSGYANAFVAQYFGAGRHDRIGAALWQGIHFALVSAVLLFGMIPFAPAIFAWAGHTGELQALETAYFQIQMLGMAAVVYNAAVSSFFTGRGKTWVILWVNLLTVGANIGLDYLWIFGRLGFPEMGIRGAGWATVVATLSGSVAFTVLFLSRENRARFGTLRSWRPDPALLRRLLRFGGPNGLQVALDMFSISAFTIFVGRLGELELAATNIAFGLNSLSFMPMIGLGIAASTIVGQRLGENKPDLAARATWASLHVTGLYCTLVALLYVAAPGVLIAPFAAEADPAKFAGVRILTVQLLRFVAFYTLFDSLNIVFSAVLRGAGDTRFVMWMMGTLAWTVMVLPTYFVGRSRFGNVYWAWVFLTAYVIVLGFAFLWRFLNGKWRDMRVIETTTPLSGAAHPHVEPIADFDA